MQATGAALVGIERQEPTLLSAASEVPPQALVSLARPRYCRRMRQRACRLVGLAVLCCLTIGASQLQFSAASASETITLRVQAIRLADDDGGRPADTAAAEFSQWVEFANASFAPAGIAFAYDPVADFAEVRSTFLNNLADPNDTFPDWRAQGTLGNEIAARYPGKVLVIMRHGPGPTSDYGGSGSPSHGFIILPGFGVSIHCGSTALLWFAHEMGHYLGLGHTMPNLPAFASIAEAAAYFVQNGRTVSVFDGDGLSDTLPDPYMRFLECATTTAAATLDGVVFQLPRDNLMSYYKEAAVLTPMQCAIVRDMAALVIRGDGRYPTNVAATGFPAGTLRFEAEDLANAHSGPEPVEQEMTGFAPYPFSPRWSQDAQLYWGAGSGKWLTLYFSVPETRRYSVFAYATLSPYFDTVSVEIDGKATGATLDAYAPAVLPSGPIEVASGIELTKGQHRVRFTVIGTNGASFGHGFGVDCLELRP